MATRNKQENPVLMLPRHKLDSLKIAYMEETRDYDMSALEKMTRAQRKATMKDTVVTLSLENEQMESILDSIQSHIAHKQNIGQPNLEERFREIYKEAETQLVYQGVILR